MRAQAEAVAPSPGQRGTAQATSERASRACGAVAALIGLLVAAGWLLGIEGLTRVSSGFVTMKLNTAASITALGVCLLMGRPGRWQRVLCAFAGGLAAAALVEHALRVDLGIDELVVKDPNGGSPAPGRMAVSTAIAVLLAVVAVLGGRRGAARVATAAAIGVVTISWLGVLGYVYDAGALYAVGPFDTMAAPTAVALSILGFGAMVAVPDGPASWILDGRDPGAALMRVICSIAFLALPALAELSLEGERAGWYETPFGVALIVVGSAVCLLAAGVGAARLVNRKHGATLVAHAELNVLNATLEARVEQRTAALRAAEGLFRATFDSSPMAMMLVDGGGRIRRANRALAELTGYRLDDLTAMQLSSIVRLDEAADSHPHASTLDRPVLCADGTQRWASMRWAPVARLDDEAVDDPHEPVLMVVQLVDTTERRELEARLAHLADHDPLTGLRNRRGFEDALARHAAHCERYGPTGALLMLDLDHFKRLNDTYGHNVGDQVIVAAAQLLKHRLRDSDVVARFGGDEFAVLLDSGGAAEAAVVADAIVHGLRDGPQWINGERVRLTASVGVAVFDDCRRPPEEMLVNADLAMYDAKEQGRDRWTAYATEQYDEPRLKARLSWIQRIEAALELDRFELHAQPIIDLTTGEAVQHELLIRMLGDDGELIPPATFLYIAERYGLAPKIDQWVLRQAADLLTATSSDPYPVVLGVNISGASLADSDVLADIEHRVCSGQFAPERLVLEITETAAIANVADARTFAERLRSYGCRIALDDFGAGFGSFYYLKHLPFDYLKIDGEFIARCLDDATDQAIIRSLVDLARSLGKETVAEHVSSDRVRRFLRQRGVDHGQGFHLGRPAPLTTMLANAQGRPIAWALPDPQDAADTLLD